MLHCVYPDLLGLVIMIRHNFPNIACALKFFVMILRTGNYVCVCVCHLHGICFNFMASEI